MVHGFDPELAEALAEALAELERARILEAAEGEVLVAQEVHALCSSVRSTSRLVRQSMSRSVQAALEEPAAWWEELQLRLEELEVSRRSSSAE